MGGGPGNHKLGDASKVLMKYNFTDAHLDVEKDLFEANRFENLEAKGIALLSLCAPQIEDLRLKFDIDGDHKLLGKLNLSTALFIDFGSESLYVATIPGIYAGKVNGAMVFNQNDSNINEEAKNYPMYSLKYGKYLDKTASIDTDLFKVKNDGENSLVRMNGKQYGLKERLLMKKVGSKKVKYFCKNMDGFEKYLEKTLN